MMVMPAARMFDAVSIASSVVPNIFCCDAKASTISCGTPERAPLCSIDCACMRAHEMHVWPLEAGRLAMAESIELDVELRPESVLTVLANWMRPTRGVELATPEKAN